MQDVCPMNLVKWPSSPRVSRCSVVELSTIAWKDHALLTSRSFFLPTCLSIMERVNKASLAKITIFSLCSISQLAPLFNLIMLEFLDISNNLISGKRLEKPPCKYNIDTSVLRSSQQELCDGANSVYVQFVFRLTLLLVVS